MSKSNRDPKPSTSAKPKPFGFCWHLCISAFVLFHLTSIALTYSTNRRRSSIEDRILVALQPYLIGLNWYQEMLPIEWTSEQDTPGSVRIAFEKVDTPNAWTSILEMESSQWSQAKMARMLHVSSELTNAEDFQGLTRVLHSMVLHLERGNNASRISRIRVEKALDSTSSSQEPEVLYEVSLARFPSGEFGFIPKVERHRSVKAHEAVTVSP